VPEVAFNTIRPIDELKYTARAAVGAEKLPIASSAELKTITDTSAINGKTTKIGYDEISSTSWSPARRGTAWRPFPLTEMGVTVGTALDPLSAVEIVYGPVDGDRGFEAAGVCASV
jgi:hypothetical protein